MAASEKLSVCIIQTDTHWLQPALNLQNISDQIRACPSDIDLFLLPEMFCHGFCMDPQNQPIQESHTTVQNLRELAEKHSALICGSIISKENNKYYNRFIAVDQNGIVFTYHKHHLFSYAGEDKVYAPGKERKTFTYKEWKLFPIICYDLRFPVWCRNDLDYDILLCPANWPKIRIEAWRVLLKARSIENQCFVIAANRCGRDPENDYPGCSSVLDPQGNILVEMNDLPGHHQIRLSKENLSKTRGRYPFLNDRNTFEITN